MHRRHRPLWIAQSRTQSTNGVEAESGSSRLRALLVVGARAEVLPQAIQFAHPQIVAERPLSRLIKALALYPLRKPLNQADKAA